MPHELERSYRNPCGFFGLSERRRHVPGDAVRQKTVGETTAVRAAMEGSSHAADQLFAVLQSNIPQHTVTTARLLSQVGHNEWVHKYEDRWWSHWIQTQVTWSYECGPSS